MGPENPEKLFKPEDLEEIDGRHQKVQGDVSAQGAIDEAAEEYKKGKSPEEQEEIDRNAKELKKRYEDPK